jgi:hypothetical protein
MEKRVDINEESKENDKANRKSWSELEEEESKDAKFQIMQPQDYISDIVEASKEAKIHKITEAYEEEVAGTK